MKLYDVIYNLLPPNFQTDNELLRIFNIFCELYDETYQYTNDTINTILVDKLFEKLEQTREKRYSVARKRIFKSFLNEFFDVAEIAQQDEQLYKKMSDLYNRLNLPLTTIDYVEALSKIFKDENIIALKNFNYLKGKLSGYLYVFDVIEKSKIQGVNLDGFLRLIEGTEKNPKQPFYYRVETSMFKESYYALVHPLVHPIGFGWAVLTILEFYFEDFFSSGVRTTLLELKIKCLLENGNYDEYDLMELYNIENFKEEELNNKKKFWVEFTTKTQPTERRKILSNYDGSITEYSLDNLKLYDVSLKNELDGVFVPEYDENGNFVKATYNQFFINRKKFIVVYWKIVGDLGEINYSTSIKIDINALKKVPNETYVDGITITPEMLMELTRDEIWGRTYKIWSRSCGLEYKIQYEYYSTMTDDLRFVVHKTMYELWQRRYPLNRGRYYVTAYNYRNSEKFWQPVIDEFYFGNDALSIYNPDYRNHPELPKIDDLGWKTKEWMFEERPYNEETPFTDGTERRNKFIINHQEAEYYPAWEALHGTQFHDLSGWNIVCPERVCLIGGHDYKDKHILHNIGEKGKFIGYCNKIPCRYERGDKIPPFEDEMVGLDETGFALVDDNEDEQFFIGAELSWWEELLQLTEKVFPDIYTAMKHKQTSRFLGKRSEKLRCYIGGHLHTNDVLGEHHHFHFIGEKGKFIGYCMCNYDVEGDVFKELMDFEEALDIKTPYDEKSGLILSDSFNKPLTQPIVLNSGFSLSDNVDLVRYLDSFNYKSRDALEFLNSDDVEIRDDFEIKIGD